MKQTVLYGTVYNYYEVKHAFYDIRVPKLISKFATSCSS